MFFIVIRGMAGLWYIRSSKSRYATYSIVGASVEDTHGTASKSPALVLQLIHIDHLATNPGEARLGDTVVLRRLHALL